MTDSCHVCTTYSTVPTTLCFRCVVCNEPMREVVAPDLGMVLHCPEHCTTLLPSREMIEEARRCA